jgi:hypothetical protein
MSLQKSQFLGDSRGSVTVTWKLKDNVWIPRVMAFTRHQPENNPFVVLRLLEHPTDDEKAEAIRIKAGLCGKCGQQAGGEYCMRTPCRLGYVYVQGNGSYMQKVEVEWNGGVLQYQMIA